MHDYTIDNMKLQRLKLKGITYGTYAEVYHKEVMISSKHMETFSTPVRLSYDDRQKIHSHYEMYQIAQLNCTREQSTIPYEN